MPKDEWGVKRLCAACGSRYYDLKRDPIVCPKCGETYVSATSVVTKSRVTKATARAAVVPDDDEDDDVVLDDDDDLVVDDADEDDDADEVIVADVEDDEEDEDLLLPDDDDDEDDDEELDGFEVEDDPKSV